MDIRRTFKLAAGLALASLCAQAWAGAATPRTPDRIYEIHQRFDTHGQRSVALTFDACDGHFDWDLANYLVEQRIPSTIFVTAIFLERNPAAVKFLQAHADLFEAENHGAQHHAAILVAGREWGVPDVATAAGLASEVDGGASAVQRYLKVDALFFRGATAAYTAEAETQIDRDGETIAGFTVAVDGGGKLPHAAISKNVADARPGDILLGHINHPEKGLGDAMVAGITKLKAAGWLFVTLREAKALGLHQVDAPIGGHTVRNSSA